MEIRSDVAAYKRAEGVDDAHLAALGVKQELRRNFSPLAMLGLAFAILNTWTALSASLSLALPSGGSTAVLWGFLTAGFCNLCLASSLAEFLSAYPTSGGQYYWVAIISWENWRALLSWITGWINVFGWMALSALGGTFVSQLIAGIVALYNPGFQLQPWQQFLLYVAVTLFGAVVNIFNQILPLVNKVAIVWSISGFIVICITVLGVASPNFNSAKFVFTNFTNETGWPDGVAWMLGLLQGSLSLTAFDATAHMVEEIPNAAVEAPKIMIYCVAMGVFSGFTFLVCLLFVAGDIQQVIESTAGPLGQIIYNATDSRPGAVCLLMLPMGCMLFATISVITTSSRMNYAFARDRGLPFSRVFARVHPRLDVPLESLGLTILVVIAFGLISLGSSSALNAIISAAVVALGLTYAIPVTINVVRARKMLPENRPFKLPVWLGWFANLIGIAYTILTTVLFVFPPILPVSGSNMNYCIAAFGVVLIISIVQWFVDGRRNYTGPHLETLEPVLAAVESVDEPPGYQPADKDGKPWPSGEVESAQSR